MAVKPDTFPEWASDGGADKEEPINALKEQGWAFRDFVDNKHINWLFNKNYEWIKYFEDGGLFPYEDTTSLQALNGADLNNNSFYLVENKGIYRYDDTADYPIDDTYILEPNDSIGRFILFIANPVVQDERTKDLLGDLSKLVVVDYTSATPLVGIANAIIPLGLNLQILNRINWRGDINSLSGSNTNGGNFFGIMGSLSAPAQTTTGNHLVNIRGMGLDESFKVVTTGTRFTIQTQETFTSTSTGSRAVVFVNPTGLTSANQSSTGLTVETDSRLTTYSHIRPNTTNNSDIGSGSLVYSNIYLQNAPTVVSDVRIKKDINNIDINKSFALFDKLTEKNAYIQFKFKNTEYQKEIFTTVFNQELGSEETILSHVENIEVKGNRFHFGLKAQELVNAMLEVGINTSDCSLVSIENYKQGDELKVYEEGTGRLTVAYSEFIPLLIQTIDNLNKRVKELENIINEGN